jgi:hypothetical protein
MYGALEPQSRRCLIVKFNELGSGNSRLKAALCGEIAGNRTEAHYDTLIITVATHF